MIDPALADNDVQSATLQALHDIADHHGTHLETERTVDYSLRRSVVFPRLPKRYPPQLVRARRDRDVDEKLLRASEVVFAYELVVEPQLAIGWSVGREGRRGRSRQGHPQKKRGIATVIEPASLGRAFAGFVMVMACFILVREGALVVATVAPALPTTWPQVVFAIVMLVLGILTGRSSSRADQTTSELAYSEGAGI